MTSPVASPSPPHSEECAESFAEIPSQISAATIEVPDAYNAAVDGFLATID